MSELLPPSERVDRADRADRQDVRQDVRWDAWRDDARGGHAVDGIQALHRWVTVVPVTVMALLGTATVAFLLTREPSSGATQLVLAIAIAATLAVMCGSAYCAAIATRGVTRRLGALQALNSRGTDDLRQLVEKVQRGERPAPRSTEALPAPDSDPFALVARDLRQGQYAAQNAVLQVVNLTPGGVPDQRVEVFVNLARRMQSLVHREIQLLDDLEAQVEDPDLLKGLFTVDHLATRMRRQSESLAVLGGAVSRRQWSRPVSMQEVLRAAIAEVEHYSRVKVAPPIEGTLHGNAVADVIHLVAELVENATKFSAPHTQVVLRAEHVTSGLAIEVDDRGLGMAPADQHQINSLLADPGRVNISDLLRDGRIGLFVVSALARRHRIKVQMQTNIYGGTQAVVVLPQGLFDQTADGGGTGRSSTRSERAASPNPAPARVAPTAPAIPAAPAPQPAPQPTPPPTLQPNPQSAPTAQPAPAPQPAAVAQPAPAPAPRPAPQPTEAPAYASQHAEPGPREVEPYPQDSYQAARNSLADPIAPATQTTQAAPAAPAAPTASPAASPVAQTAHSQAAQTQVAQTQVAQAAPAIQADQDGSGWMGELPVRRPSPRPAPPEPVHAPAGTDAVPRQPDYPGRSERPRLPQRQVQTHLAPQLRDAPADRYDEPATDHTPGLMAAFQGGFNRADDEDGPLDRADGTP